MKLGQFFDFDLYRKIINPQKIMKKAENTQILIRTTLVTYVTLVVSLRVLIPIYSYVHMKPLLSMFMKGNEVTLTG